MSLIGQKSALISVGVSCQTVHQVERAIDLAREIDPTIEKKGLPLDSLMSRRSAPPACWTTTSSSPQLWRS